MWPCERNVLKVPSVAIQETHPTAMTHKQWRVDASGAAFCDEAEQAFVSNPSAETIVDATSNLAPDTPI